MNRRRHADDLATVIRFALIASAMRGAGAAANEAPVHATMLEEVLVTGSRIAASDTDTPVLFVSADDIASSGVANLQDLLQRYPVFGTPEISRTNSNFRTDSAGVATIDLRNLGKSRTLVLVNGRRVVAGIAGDSAVDLNTIPVQFIERVEVLSGGASSVYGSDAVTGVVNVIYKSDMEGIEIDARYGASAAGDDEQTAAGFTMGAGTSNGRGNLIVHLGYTEQGEVRSIDRGRSDVDQVSLGALFGQAEDMFTPLRPFYSRYTPQGRFCTDAECSQEGSYTYDQNGQLVAGFSTNGSETRAADGYDRAPYRLIAMPVERYLLATSGRYELTDDHRLFVEGTYATSRTETALEPLALDSLDVYLEPGAEGWMPVEFEAWVRDTEDPEATVRTVLRNPFVPQTVYDAAEDRTGDGLRDISYQRRLSELGPRGTVADRETMRMTGGLQGTLPGAHGWNYEAFYSYGQTTESQVTNGFVNVPNLRDALEAVPDVDDVDADGDLTEAICRDAAARARGCVPANFFGRDAISPAAAAFLSAPGMMAARIEQTVAGLGGYGDAFDLPAGSVGLALGIEYRDEYSRMDFDALQQAGLNGSQALPSSEGSFDVFETYVEARVPLVEAQPFADSLSARFAYRYSEYSTVGATDSWNVGLDWAPVPQVRVRGTRSRSTRAPNVTELFLPPSQSFPAGLADPCEGVTLVSAGVRDDRCRAEPGVLENIRSHQDPLAAPDGIFVVTEADALGISGYELGNLALDEETGDSWTIGVVYTPFDDTAQRGVEITIDYLRFEIDEAIAFVPRQYSLDQCYAGDGSTCALITRRAGAAASYSSGSLALIDSPFANSGGIVSDGIDTTVTYVQDLASWGLPGRLDLTLVYSHTLNGYFVPVPGAARDRLTGEVGNSKDRAQLAVGYTFSGVHVDWRATYIGPAALDDQFLHSYGIDAGSVTVGATTTHDLQLSWSPEGPWEIYVGATNLFDEDPPPILTLLPGSSTGTETDAGTYDAIGRRYYAGVRARF